MVVKKGRRRLDTAGPASKSDGMEKCDAEGGAGAAAGGGDGGDGGDGVDGDEGGF
jgi:hypothetical protein